MKVLLIVAAMVTMATCYQSYQSYIPNGEKVPDPCNPGSTYPGVGHLALHGTGPRNVFGQAFHDAQLQWTSALCWADSDRDGMTNGQELGDPSCIWTGGSYLSGPAIAHPGICEPVGSEKCKWQNFTCPSTTS